MQYMNAGVHSLYICWGRRYFIHSFIHTLGDNLITSHQVDYMFSALIPAEAVENNQEHLVANKVGCIRSLV